MRIQRSQSGFTIVELLIVGVVVILVVGGMTIALASSGQRVWTLTDSQMAALSAVQRGLSRVSEDLTTASAATVTCPAGQLSFGQDTDGDGAINRTLAFSYDPGARQLLRTIDNGAPEILAGQLSGFSSSCPGNGLVRLWATAQVPLPGTTNRTVSRTLGATVWVRNP